MIILPPNFKYVDAISYRPIPFEPYEIILVIKDKYGTIIGIYEYKRIAETTVHYVEFITPSEEGPYIIEKWYRVVATTKSFSASHKIYKATFIYFVSYCSNCCVI